LLGRALALDSLDALASLSFARLLARFVLVSYEFIDIIFVFFFIVDVDLFWHSSEQKLDDCLLL
jgi:hypothetical protein